MFVLPPPPRFPSSQYGLGMPGQPVIETNNVLSHPTGPEHQLVVGEGNEPPQAYAPSCILILRP